MQASVLNQVLESCLGGAGTLTCATFSKEELIVDGSGCKGDKVDTSIGTAVEEYSWEGVESEFSCSLG